MSRSIYKLISPFIAC